MFCLARSWLTRQRTAAFTAPRLAADGTRSPLAHGGLRLATGLGAGKAPPFLMMIHCGFFGGFLPFGGFFLPWDLAGVAWCDLLATAVAGTARTTSRARSLNKRMGNLWPDRVCNGLLVGLSAL